MCDTKSTGELPEKTLYNLYTQEDVKLSAHRMNRSPRRLLKERTAHQPAQIE